VSAFGAMAEALANGKNAFVSFKDAFLKGMGDMLIKIGQMILKQALLNALQGGGGANGGVGSYFSNAISALFKHTGGIANSGTRRNVPMHVFANAQRYHSGGLPGLKSGEVAAVLQTNEEVLTRQDPRHILNGGGAANVQVKNVNVIDGSDLLEQALATDRGEKVLFNFMSRNSRKIAGII